MYVYICIHKYVYMYYMNVSAHHTHSSPGRQTIVAQTPAASAATAAAALPATAATAATAATVAAALHVCRFHSDRRDPLRVKRKRERERETHTEVHTSSSICLRSKTSGTENKGRRATKYIGCLVFLGLFPQMHPIMAGHICMLQWVLQCVTVRCRKPTKGPFLSTQEPAKEPAEEPAKELQKELTKVPTKEPYLSAHEPAKEPYLSQQAPHLRSESGVAHPLCA